VKHGRRASEDDDGDGHHRDADGISMKAGRRAIDAHGRCSKGAEANDDAHPADCHDGSAGTLHEDEKQAGEIDCPGLCAGGVFHVPILEVSSDSK